MRNRYDAEFWVRIARRFRFVLDNALRISHIALWMTIPTTFWLWLGLAETPVECVPKYGWYSGNVLCVSEDTHIWITFGLFLIGFFGFGCWIFGYGLQLISRALCGDETLLPVRLRVFAEGFGMIFFCGRYWLPAIAAAVTGYTLLSRLDHVISDHGVSTLMLALAPIALAMYWGNLVGLARFYASGKLPLIWRRRENMRLALTNIRATLALTILLILLSILCVVAWIGLSVILPSWRELEFMVEAALGSFGFYFALLTCTIACSRLVARYAIKIGISDQLMPNAAYDWRRFEGQKRAACGVLE